MGRMKFERRLPHDFFRRKKEKGSCRRPRFYFRFPFLTGIFTGQFFCPFLIKNEYKNRSVQICTERNNE